MRKLLTIPLLVLAFIASIWLYNSVFYSPAIRARVTAPDGTPIAGAVVVIGWTVAAPMSGAPLRQLELVETVTDKDGWFRIPAWGPRLAAFGSIRVDEPTTRIYKAGFVPAVVDNYDGVPMSGAGPVIRFLHQDRPIVLTPFKGSLAEYAATFWSLNWSLDTVYGGRETAFCYWRRMPRMSLALQELKLEMDQHGVANSLRMAHDHANIPSDAACGDAQQFFRTYSQEK